MTLLARQLLVGDQPAVDHLRPRIHRRPEPARILLTRRRRRAGQCLAHRPPVHLMPLSQLPDRQPADPAVTPDLLEDLHPRSHPLAEPSRPPDITRRSHPRWGQNSCRHAGPTTIGDAPPQAGPKFTPKAASNRGRSRDPTPPLPPAGWWPPESSLTFLSSHSS